MPKKRKTSDATKLRQAQKLLNEIGAVYTIFQAADVKGPRPNWSDDRCAEELCQISGGMEDRLCELGFEVMDSLLPYDAEDVA